MILNVYADDKLLSTKKLIKINPGEMERVEVSAKDLAGVSAVKIDVVDA